MNLTTLITGQQKLASYAKNHRSEYGSKIKNQHHYLVFGNGTMEPLRWLIHFGNEKSKQDTVPYIESSSAQNLIQNLGFHPIRHSDSEAQFSELWETLVEKCREYDVEPSGPKQVPNQEPRVFWVVDVLSADSIVSAMQAFQEGARPQKYGNRFEWYVIEPKTQYSYPLKAVWALATMNSCSDFKSGQTIRKKLRGFGFDCVKISSTKYNTKFQGQVRDSLKLSTNTRRASLENAAKYPAKIIKTVVTFRRNPDVVAERLDLANGRCEKCEGNAPFLKKKDNEPYLEVHHRIQLSQDGQDTVENTIALCPNCHREAHYG